MTPDTSHLASCPPESAWDELATGLTQGTEAETLLQHASWCEPCGVRLRASLQVFEPDPNALTLVKPPSRQMASWWWATAASLILAIGSGWWLLRGPSDPRTELAQLTAVARPFAMRFRGAPHGVSTATRGAAEQAGAADRLAIAAAIARGLVEKPQDPNLLAAQGRLALIEQDPDTALGALKAAMDLGGPEDLAVDLGIAYWLRGRRDGHAADIQMAIEVLGRYLQKHPRDSAAYFNRALAEEELLQFAPALEDLTRALEEERSEEWKAEIRERLAKLKARQGAFFERPAGEDAERFAEVALDEALAAGLWLGRPREQLNALAGRLEREHGDAWLRHLLGGPPSPAVDEALPILARLASIRLVSAIGSYEAEDARASRLAALTLPRAFRWWRELEETYRAARARERYACPVQAEILPGEFAWLKSQLLRERGACAHLARDVGRAARLIQEAIDAAEGSGLRVSWARASGMAGALESRQGEYRVALNRAWKNASIVESGRLPVVRIHESFNIMTVSAERLGRLHAAKRAAMMSAHVADATGLPNLTFTNLMHWGELALRTGDPSAQSVFRTAAVKAEASDAAITTPGWRAWANMALADAAQDPTLLAPYEQTLAGSEDFRLRAPFSLVKARFESAAGQPEAALARLASLTEELNPGIWHEQAAQATELTLEILLRQGRHQEAFLRLQRSRGGEPASLAGVVFALATVQNRMAVWRWTERRLDFRWAGITLAEYDTLRRRLLRVASSPAGALDDLQRTARELGTQLFGPWLSELDSEQPVLFQTSAALGDLPFALLPGKQEALAFEVIWSETRDAIRPPRVQPVQTALAVDATSAPIPPAWRLAPLSPASSEIAALTAVRPATRILRGSEAHSQVLRSAAAGLDVLHFAGHAVPRADGAALLLADGPFALSGFRSPALVVLSACGTARSARDEVDQLDSVALARHFLAKGSRQVIASYWKVEHEASATFMRHFYQALGQTGDTGRAMREAFRSWRGKHPTYWGVYTRIVRGEAS